MDVFLDTSALMKYYIDEAGSEAVRLLMEEAEVVFVSPITWIECFSTLKRILHEGLLGEEEYHRLKDEIRHDLEYFTQVPQEEAYDRCEALIDSYQLKTLDSIQLSSALAGGSEVEGFVSCDEKLNAAAKSEGLKVINPLFQGNDPDQP